MAVGIALTGKQREGAYIHFDEMTGGSRSIQRLVSEEMGAMGPGLRGDVDRERLENVQVKRVQCWDVLRRATAVEVEDRTPFEQDHHHTTNDPNTRSVLAHAAGRSRADLIRGSGTSALERTNGSCERKEPHVETMHSSESNPRGDTQRARM